MKSLQRNSKGGTPVWRSMKWQPLMTFDNLTFSFFSRVELLGVASKAGKVSGSAREGQGHTDMDHLLSWARHSPGWFQPEREKFMPIKLQKNTLSLPVIPAGFVWTGEENNIFEIAFEIHRDTWRKEKSPAGSTWDLGILRKILFSTSVWKKKNVTVDTALGFSPLFFAKMH